MKRAVSYRISGNGHGDGTDYGSLLISVALLLTAAAAWLHAVAPGERFWFRVMLAAAMLAGYMGVLRRVRRTLNWLELLPGTTLVPKSEIDGFVTLTGLLIAAAGLSLVGTNPPLVGLCIAFNLVCGLMIVDSSRRLRRNELSSQGTTQNVVNPGVYAQLRLMLRWQLRFLLMALAVSVLAKL